MNETETKVTNTKLDDLRAIFEQAEAFAVWVVSKNDFSPEGEREFSMAVNTARIAFDNLYYAEQAADRAQPA
jgi:hypothetical protein